MKRSKDTCEESARKLSLNHWHEGEHGHEKGDGHEHC